MRCWLAVRPQGDEYADIYGTYLGPLELKRRRKIGEEFDVLSSDGLNYMCTIVQVKPNGDIKLHFPHWGKKYDYVGDMTKLYLANKATFSKEAGISEQNKYPELIMRELVGKSKAVGKRGDQLIYNPGGGPSRQPKRCYEESTRHDDDFLKRPRPSLSGHTRRTRIKAEEEDNLKPKRIGRPKGSKNKEKSGQRRAIYAYRSSELAASPDGHDSDEGSKWILEGGDDDDDQNDEEDEDEDEDDIDGTNGNMKHTGHYIDTSDGISATDGDSYACDLQSLDEERAGDIAPSDQLIEAETAAAAAASLEVKDSTITEKIREQIDVLKQKRREIDDAVRQLEAFLAVSTD